MRNRSAISGPVRVQNSGSNSPMGCGEGGLPTCLWESGVSCLMREFVEEMMDLEGFFGVPGEWDSILPDTVTGAG